jgi:hypothetical protein
MLISDEILETLKNTEKVSSETSTTAKKAA